MALDMSRCSLWSTAGLNSEVQPGPVMLSVLLSPLACVVLPVRDAFLAAQRLAGSGRCSQRHVQSSRRTNNAVAIVAGVSASPPIPGAPERGQLSVTASPLTEGILCVR